jgi:hypothetical protein
VKAFATQSVDEALPEPSAPVSLAEFETRPETVVARASQRPPAKPESVPPPTVPYPDAPRSVEAENACARPPLEAMTPFLGTATAGREVLPASPSPAVISAAAPSDEWNAESEPELMLDVPIHVEILDPSAAEDGEIGRAEQPDDLTEPFFMDDEAGAVWSRGSFSFRDAKTQTVAEAFEIELEQSPAPLREAVAESLARVVAEAEAELLAPIVLEAETETPARVMPKVAEIAGPVVVEAAEVVVEVAAPVVEVDEVVVEAAEAVAEAPVVEAAEVVAEAEAEVAEVPVVEVVPPPKGEFDDVEMAVLLPSATPPLVGVRKRVPDEGSLLPPRPLPRPRSSDVEELMRHFAGAPEGESEEHDVRSTLKRLAGLDPTAVPPDVGRR